MPATDWLQLDQNMTGCNLRQGLNAYASDETANNAAIRMTPIDDGRVVRFPNDEKYSAPRMHNVTAAAQPANTGVNERIYSSLSRQLVLATALVTKVLSGAAR
jgi:hypothetical protein